MMLDTLGEVVTCAVAIVAVILVPLAIARAWWPEVKRAMGNTITWIGGAPAALMDMFFMSSSEHEPPRKADMDAVSIPVSHTSMDAHTTAPALDITEDYEMPRISRTLSDQELITVLALQRKDGKYRSSANKIAEYMGGDRNTVLAWIKAAREGPPAPQVREHQARLEQLQKESA